MLKIFLARHGQDLDNVAGILNGRRDMALSEKGLEQAREVAEKIKAAGMSFDKIYSSPLQRAFNTAMIICLNLGLPEPEVMADLTERDFGIMTGKTHADIVPMLGDGAVFSEVSGFHYMLKGEGLETFPETLARANKVLEKVQAENTDGNILLVTHGDIGKMIYAAYYKLDWMKVLMMFHFGNSDLLELSAESGAENAHVFKIKQFNL